MPSTRRPYPAQFRAEAVRLIRESGRNWVVFSERFAFCAMMHRNPNQESALDLVERRFTQDAPDRLWVADMTEHATDEGKLYLAVVIDAFSRMVVGWSMGTRPVSDLAVDAVNMAVWNRRLAPGVIHHIMRTTRREDVDELIQLIEAKRPSIKRIQRTEKSSRFDWAH